MNAILPGYQLLESIHTGFRTVIYRGLRESDHAPIIIKTLQSEYPTLEDITRLRHEYKIIQTLEIEGIVKAYSLESYQHGLALLLEDCGGVALKDWMNSQPIPILSFLSIGIQLVSTLTELHKNNIIHKDIKPHNIIITPLNSKVKIIDFSIASKLERENPSLSHPDLLEGTLAYMSPEQTGRMNRTVDYRTDFYSLGVTFYEMLTGEVPFDTLDALELVHCHIAKVPVPPHHLNPEIPEAVSSLVMKLLAKTAEDRYQSAEGLKFDLETCLLKLQTTGTISGFIAGSADKAGLLNIPQKLYGREAEVSTLLETFDRVSCGNTEMMLVSGYSGIGKTVLVNEVHKPIVRQRGYFIAGKFDQFKRNIPFASLIQAFQSLIQQLLTESEAQTHIWKEKLLSALASNGQVIIDVIPEVELITGKQPAVTELGATESQNRFSRVFKQFIGVFTTEEHPLVVFLDDLQWADSASLKLIELLITDADSKYLLLIGAYRDNEVFPTHPTVQTIEKIQAAGATVNNIVLEPLQLIHVEELIAETLNESVRSKPLSELLFNKTQGNPFFLTQLLKTLYQENLLIYELASSTWQWNLEQIQVIGITDYNVVELIARNILKLPVETQKVLKLAACIGNTFNLEVLSVVSEEFSLAAAAQLWPALQAGLILPLSNEYKIPLAFTQEESAGITLTDIKVDYKFLHDRVQQAAYSQIPDEQKKQTHLKIGQLLLQNTTPEERKENIFALVNQLNYGIDLLTSESEKYELAELNLIAGQKAKAATAHDSAVKYLNVGLGLLASDSWECQYALTFTLYLETAEAEYLIGNFEQLNQLSEVLLKCAKTLLEKVKVYELKIQFDIAQSQLQSAIDTSVSVLEMFGVHLEQEPPQNLIIDDLADLPAMTDAEKLASMRILKTSVTAAYLGNAAMLAPILFTMISLSIRYGNSPESAYAYVWYGCLLSGAMGEIESGYQFGKLAVPLLKKLDCNTLKSKIICILYALINHWKNHISENLEPLLEGTQSGLEVGDLEFASHDAANYCNFAFFKGEQLEKMEIEHEKYLALTIKCKQDYDINFIKVYGQLIKNLLGKAPDKLRLSGDVFNEEEMLPIIKEGNNGTLRLLYYVAQTILLYSFKDYKGTVASATLAAQNAHFGVGTIHNIFYNFYHSLALLALYPAAEAKEKEEYLSQVVANQEKMKTWAFHAPSNFQHKYDLVEAEKAQVLGLREEAIDYYERAIQAAKAQKYIQEEALANELAAEFHLFLGRDKIAKTYMTDAYYGYIRWGAKAKVEDLEERYPQLLASVLNQKMSEKTGETIMQTIQGTITATGSEISEFLDLATVMKASQAIAGEIVLSNLLDKLMKILIENAGAQTGSLILPKNGEFFIEATGTKDEVQVLPSLPLSTSQQLPVSVLNYVIRTQKDVVLNDASSEEIFKTDAYIIQHKIKSLLCTPIFYQGKVTAILYLENNLVAGAFTPKRVEILRMLSTQAAIAIENATLYHTLEVKVEERTEELQQKNSHLQIEIKERQRAEKTAEAANQAKSRFLANMSHELRTPLNGVLGYAQILKRDKNLTPQQTTGVNIIHQCGEHLLMLINDVLDLSKIEAGKMDINLTEFHFSQFLQSIVEICRIRAEQKGVSLNYEPITQLPIAILADEKRLRQIVINLLGNAVKFTEAGGVTFKVGYVNDSSFIAHDSSPSPLTKIRFQVEDTGIGIAPEKLSKIFLPFEQVGDTAHQTEGTGLGLAISRQLVEMMGGELKVESAAGKGSVFWFDIELTEVEGWAKYQKQAEKIIRGYAGAKRKILVVDDKWENRFVVVNLLAPLGFEVKEATDGEDCLNKAAAFHPDCIFTDLVMPVMDGFEAIRRIRKSPELKNVVIIGTSASVFEAEKEGSLEAGCDAFIPKPIRAEDLFECLSRLLNLEWIYELEVIAPDSSVPTIPESSQEKEVIAPPAEELSLFLEFAMSGDLQGIQKQAGELKNLSPQFAAFANHLIQLANDFEEEKILEFVQQSLEVQS
ncbi:hybrid sensor histidine kinase/response regulator [Microcoleus sp. FACHB-672]|uniref:hybrid sensor histidine kinase/response regulator n=1 Tax=Microcoleus sp. FACHB-672 TaxID=2692825 RepID=UPI00168904C2|nr:hybrid sensor histidine kinase/response regulator [Microcoleus sp. FACHB-672]MBD2043923.1 AAA family ATPase [Microcoleus sp. FACHB-672]